jgi:hypothetical protein
MACLEKKLHPGLSLVITPQKQIDGQYSRSRPCPYLSDPWRLAPKRRVGCVQGASPRNSYAVVLLLRRPLSGEVHPSTSCQTSQYCPAGISVREDSFLSGEYYRTADPSWAERNCPEEGDFFVTHCGSRDKHQGFWKT